MPISSYSWMLYKQPDVRKQLEEEVQRQIARDEAAAKHRAARQSAA